MDRSNYKGYRRAPQARAQPMFPKTGDETIAQPATPKRRRQLSLKRKNKYLRPLIALIILALLVFFAYEYAHTKNQLEKLSNPKTATASATQQLVDSVGRLVNLPTGETPTIATVNDAAKLKSQAFFADAKDGDKVLIYSKSGRAVLYRPSTNRVIEYSTVNLSGGTGQ